MELDLDFLATLAVIAGLAMIVIAAVRLRPNLSRIQWPATQRSHLMLMRDGYMVAMGGQALHTLMYASEGSNGWVVVSGLAVGWLAYCYMRMNDTIDSHRRRYPVM